jgi:hypothetical protein
MRLKEGAMNIKTTVGQVAMVGGDRYDQPSSILVDERTTRFAKGRKRGNLYVLVEVSGQAIGRDYVTKELLEAVRDTYYGLRGSITAGLQEAIRKANALLFEENRSSLPGEQRTAGMSCVALRDDDLFVGQAGPAVAYLVRDGQVARFPEISPWLEAAASDEPDSAPLGTRSDVNVALYHNQVKDGDIALLLETGLARGLKSQTWDDILASASTEGLLRTLLDSGQGSDLSALVLHLGGGVATSSPVRAAAQEEAEGSPTAGGDIAEAGTVLREKAGRLEGTLRAAGPLILALIAGVATSLATLFKRLMPGPPRSDQAPRRQPSPVTTTRRTPRRRSRTAASRARGESVQKLLTALAVAIPLVVAGVVLVVLMRRGQAERGEIEALWESASASWTSAQTSTDDAEARTYLEDAEQSVLELLERRPDHADAADLQQRIRVLTDQINHVERINRVAALNTYPGDADLTRVVVQGTNIFVLDRNAGRLYHHRLDEAQQALEPGTQNNVLVSKGDVVGDVLVADLVDLAWIPVGGVRQKAGLGILESGGALLEFDPTTGELMSQQLVASDTWQFPKLVGGFFGRFYLLDSIANKIWRYPPTSDGNFSAPDDWLRTDADLMRVEDMAIGNSIYLLNADGAIDKLTAGEPDRFDISGWDTPPENPSALFTRRPEDVKWVYVADRGNSRIVQAGKEGEFARQFWLADAQTAEGGNPLDSVSSLFVDEIGGRAYILSGQTLYLVMLPE